MNRVLRISSAAALTFALATPLVSADQRRRGASGREQVPVEVSLKFREGRYEAKAAGSCTHAPMASIYNVRSQMWTVRQQDGERSVQLTLWKPADGSAGMFSLSFDGGPSVAISTVRGGEVTGSGTVTLEAAGKGGTFTIAAKGKAGEAVTGTIKCDAFTPAIAEGGN